MFRLAVCFVLLGVSAAYGDDLRVGGASPTGTLAAEESVLYTGQLEHVLAIIEATYVRPTLRADLVDAGLAGLHEAVRVPIPAAFRRELQQARSDEAAGKVLKAMAAAGLAVPIEFAAEFQSHALTRLRSLIGQTRERLGNIEELRGHRALFISLRAIARTLDPHCGLITTEEARRAELTEASEGFGIGVAENHGAGPLVVQTVVPGGPAQRAGLRPGDRIKRINGKVVDGDPALAALLQPAAAAPVVGLNAPVPPEAAPRFPEPITLMFERAGMSTGQTVYLEPGLFHGETVLGVQRWDDNSWDYWLDRAHGIAYVRISALNHTTPGEVSIVLAQLAKQKLRGLILDLRWCPGGFLDSAVSVAQLFVGSASVASVHYRDGPSQEYRGADDAKGGDFALLVLVNGESSGGAELIAAALQDHHRGIVAGQRTLGKGSIQKHVPLPNDASLKLTSGTFLRPSGKNLHRFPNSKPADDWGVRPDPGMEFRVSADVARQVKEWYLLQSLRPGKSREILPLDDPANDPQRQEALRVLEQTVALQKRVAEK